MNLLRNSATQIHKFLNDVETKFLENFWAEGHIESSVSNAKSI